MSLIHYQDIVLDNTSKPVPNATVAVYITGTQTYASLFSDAAGTQPLTNPVTTDSFGRFSFYLNTGTVDITITGTNIFSYSATGVAVGNQATTLEGFTWEAPGTVGSTTPNTGAFTTLVSNTLVSKNIGGVRYADQFSGADIGAKINAAAADLGSTGGIIVVPKGSYTYSTTINFDQLRDITLQGAGGQTAGAAAATQLTYTGTGVAISARSSTSISIVGLQIVWNNAAIVGPIIDFSHVVATDSTWAEVSHCSFFGIGGISAPIVIQLDKTINSCIHYNTLQNYVIGITGAANSGSYSNAIKIDHNNFSSSAGTAQTAHIQNPGQAWQITNNTFEMGSGAGTPSVISYAGGATSVGVVISGNWVGDSGTTSATYFTLSGSGFYVNGNFIAGTAANTTTAIALTNSSFGIVITGNKIVNHSIGILFGASNRQINVSGNDVQTVTTPISGAPTSGYVADFGNNDSVSIRTSSNGTFTVNSNNLSTIVDVSVLNSQSNNVAQFTIYTVPSDGFYRVSSYEVITQAASTGAVMPQSQIFYTDRYTSASESLVIFNNSSQNGVGAKLYGASYIFPAKSGTAIQASTSNYSSVGATQMLYTVVWIIEYLGS